MAAIPKYKPVAYRNTSGAGKIKPGKPPKVVAPAKGTVAGAAGGTASKPKRPPYRPPVGAAPSGDPTLQSIIDSITKPQLDFYQQQQSALDARHRAAQDAWRQLTGQMIGLLQGVPGQIGSDYDQAIQQTGQLSQAAAQGLASANPNAQTLANLQAINAPQQQQADVTAHNADVFGGGSGVLNFLGGTVPQQGLVANKAANMGFARTLPFIADENANQQLARLLSTQSGESSAVDQAIAQMRSDASKQAYGILNDYQSQKLAQQRFNADQAYRQQQLGLSRARLSQQGDLGWARLKQQSSGYSKTITKADGSVVGITKDGKTQVLLPAGSVDRPYRGGSWSTKVLRDGSVVQTNSRTGQVRTVSGPNPAWATGGKTGGSGPRVYGYTQGQAVTYRAKAAQGAKSMYYGFNAVDKKGNKTWHRALTYQEALAEMKKEKVPVQFANEALDNFYQRGKRGRPWLNQTERDALVSAGIATRAQVNAAANKASLAMPLLRRLKQSGGAATGSPLASGSTTASKVIAEARKYVGTPYHYGGASPATGFDCSGLLTWSFGKQGIRLPHNAAQQFHMGTPVAPNDLQAGDAVFFITDGTAENPGHVGIYLGNGLVLTAPHTGAVVRIDDLAAHEGYVGARRYV